MFERRSAPAILLEILYGGLNTGMLLFNVLTFFKLATIFFHVGVFLRLGERLLPSVVKVSRVLQNANQDVLVFQRLGEFFIRPADKFCGNVGQKKSLAFVLGGKLAQNVLIPLPLEAVAKRLCSYSVVKIISSQWAMFRWLSNLESKISAAT